MRGNENLNVPVLSSNSLRRPHKISNPEDPIHFKTQLSPSNKSDTFPIDRQSKKLFTDKFNNKNLSPFKTQLQDLEEKIKKHKSVEKSLREEIKETHKENTELTIANQALRTQLFARVQQLAKAKQFEETIRQLELECLEAQKTIIDLQVVIKNNNDFKRVQQEAKKKNMEMLEEMELQNIQLNEVYSMEKSRCTQLTQRIIKYQQTERKNRNKIKDLEIKLQEKIQRESSISSSRATDRENEKIKILMSINQRQKAEIVELYSVIQQKSKGSRDVGLKEIAILKSKISEQETQIAIIRKQNQELKSLSVIKEQNQNIKELQKQISLLNEKVFNYNSQNNELREELDEYYTRCRQLEEVNVTLTNQCRELDGKIIRYMKQISGLTDNVKMFESIKQEYGKLEEQKRSIQLESCNKINEMDQIRRRNRQLLQYNEELRVEGEKARGQVIELQIQIDQLKQLMTGKPNRNNTPLELRDKSHLSRSLKERNILLVTDFHKFKGLVIDELRIISLELIVRQNQYKNEESQILISGMRKRVDNLLLQF